MDGYSVNDAATVLGVPEARVWELIARGVLAGSPEADGGMRVFLKPSEAPAKASPRGTDAPDAAAPDARRQNGNGGRHVESHPEMSPFRELLTEFRNLTERYGQALLALGESRGEVAALRGRVDMLEARIDLRLPVARPTSTVAWEMPDHAATPGPAQRPVDAPQPRVEAVGPELELEPDEAGETIEPPPDEPAAMAEPIEEPSAEPEPARAARPTTAPSRRATVRKERLRSRRMVLGGIAEALARAEDPTLAELPGAREAAEALAELQRESAPAVEVPPPAEAIEVGGEVEDEEPAESDAPEPVSADPIMDVAMAKPATAEPATAEPATAEPAPEERAIAEPIPDQPEIPEAAFAEPVLPEPALPEPELPSGAPIEAQAESVEAERAAEVREPIEADVEPPVAADEQPVPAQEDHSPYSTDVVEPDWFADGDFTWLEAADAQPGPEADAEPPAADAPAANAPAADAPGEESPVATEDASEQEPDADQDVLEPAADTDVALVEDDTPAGENVDASADIETGPAAPDTAPEERAPSGPAEQHRQSWWPAEEQLGGVEPDVGMDLPGTASRREEPGSSAIATATATTEEEVMWLGDEFEEAGLEVATHGWRGQAQASSQAEPSVQAATSATQEEGGEKPIVLELSDDELARLAEDEGWDLDEVEAIRTFLGRDAETGEPAPETNEPASETNEPAPETNQAAPETDAPPPEAGMGEVPPADLARDEPPGYEQPDYDEHRPPRPGDPAWLHGRRGPAATAYRRLRRLFPD
jgi:hypothetical protein